MRPTLRPTLDGAPAPEPPAPDRQDEPSDEVDDASESSFPASDPPSWEPLHIGSPDKHPQRTEPPEHQGR
jgi:hypothetical protein